MSIASVNQFYQVAMQDPALKQQFHTAAGSDQELLQMAVEQGQKYGYNFTTEEVAQAIAATQLPAETNGNIELSDQQLEAVAGGKSDSGVGQAISSGQGAGRAVGNEFLGVVGAVGGFFDGLFNPGTNSNSQAGTNSNSQIEAVLNRSTK